MKSLAIKLLTVFVFVTILIQPLGFALALESEELGVQKQKVNPGSFYYFFKRAYEKLRAVFIFSSEARISYNESLLEKRLSELDYVTENKVLSEIEKASQRFSFYAGVTTEELEKTREAGDKERLLEKFEKYSKFLAQVRDRFPANSGNWLSVQQNIDTLGFLSERLTD